MNDPITHFRGEYWFLNLFYPVDITTTLRVNGEPLTLTFMSAGHLLAACKVYHFRKGTPSKLKTDYVLAVQKATTETQVRQLSNAAPVLPDVWKRVHLAWIKKVQKLKFLGGFNNNLLHHLVATGNRPILVDALESLALEDLRTSIHIQLQEKLDSEKTPVL